LQFVAQGIEIAAFETPLFPLSFPSFHQMLQTTRPLGRGLSAFGALPVSFHAQLILALTRDSEARKLVLNPISHLSMCESFEKPAHAETAGVQAHS